MTLPPLFRLRAVFPAALLGGALLFSCALSPVRAADLRLDTDEILKPLVDTTKGTDQDTGQDASRPATMLEGQVDKQGEAPAQKPLVLTGKVQTLQEAIESERATVDWYAWYLACRQYLARTGGLHCALGTPIKFYRDGRIEAATFDPVCLQSVSGRKFPLPRQTKLDALILPVRRGGGPPASPQEIYSRIDALRGR